MAGMSQDPAPVAPRRQSYPIAIEDVAGWVLRIGVISSVTILVVGLALAFFHGGLTRQVMETQAIQPDVGALWRGVMAFQAFAWLELGIFVLVATPIMRVFTAMVLFAVEEHDKAYTVVTLLVLVMTLASLLFIR